MSVFTTDFSEYTTGQPPSDWSDYWSSGAFTFLAQANSGDFKVGSKKCRFLISSDTNSAVTWDDIGDVADSDIIIKASVESSAGGARVYSRVSGSSGAENGYFLIFGISGQLYLYKMVNGASTAITSIIISTLSYTDYWIRFQTVGTTLRGKIWSVDTVEPAEWKISGTDSSLTSGHCGVGAWNNRADFNVDYFSCGTGSDLALFPPTGWELSDRFGFISTSSIQSAYLQTPRAMGGLFETTGRQLVGVRLYCDTHNDDVRVAVYTGGALATGPNNATLLYDFGKTTGTATGYVELTCPPVNIPTGVPLWIVAKGDNPSGFEFTYTTARGNSGNYQIANGRADLTNIISNDPDVVYPATMPDTNATFGDYWYPWDILLDSSSASIPSINPSSGECAANQLITITCTTPGSTIYYTEDDSDPTESSTEYTAPFTLGTAKTIKAFAVATGLNDSDIASETYTIAAANEINIRIGETEITAVYAGDIEIVEVYVGDTKIG